MYSVFALSFSSQKPYIYTKKREKVILTTKTVVCMYVREKETGLSAPAVKTQLSHNKFAMGKKKKKKLQA